MKSIFKKEKNILPWRILSGCMIIFAPLLVYMESLQNGLTNWDDEEFFLRSAAIHDFNWSSIFGQQNGGNYYPLTILSLAADNALCGGKPLCFHLSSLILHFFNGCMVLLFLQKLIELRSDVPSGKDEAFKEKWIGISGAALVVLMNPLNVECVSWMSARNHVLGAFFELASLYAYLKFIKEKSIKNWWLTFLLFIAAILSKSGAFVLPLVFIAVDVFLSDDGYGVITKGNFWRRQLMEKLAYALPVGLVVTLTMRSRDIVQGPIPEIFQLSLIDRIIWAGKGVVFYLSRTFVPRQLSAYYDIRLISLDWIDGAVIFCIFLFCIFVRKSRWVHFGLFWFFVHIGPFLKIVPFGEYSIFNDRYVYMPSLGLAMAFWGGIRFFNEDKSAISFRLKNVISISAAVVLIFWGFTAKTRTSVWADGEALWKDVIQKFPLSSLAHNNLGRVYLERNELDKAKKSFEEALIDRPNLAYAYYNLGLVAQNQKKIDEALFNYKEAVRLRPLYPEAHNNLGNIYANISNDYSAAALSFSKAIESGANFPEAFYNLAYCHYRMGNNAEAEKVLKFLLIKWPAFTMAQKFMLVLQK